MKHSIYIVYNIFQIEKDNFTVHEIFVIQVIFLGANKILPTVFSEGLAAISRLIFFQFLLP